MEQGSLEILRLNDANLQEPSESVVRSIQFHPSAQLLLTAGFDKKLRLFQIDGKKNPKVQSVYLQDTPIHTAAFVDSGNKVLCSGRRKHVYLYDLHSSKVERVSLKVRQEKSLENFIASNDGSLAAFFGNEGHILMFYMKSRQFIRT